MGERELVDGAGEVGDAHAHKDPLREISAFDLAEASWQLAWVCQVRALIQYRTFITGAL